MAEIALKWSYTHGERGKGGTAPQQLKNYVCGGLWDWKCQDRPPVLGR